MALDIPTLGEVRKRVRDDIGAHLPGSDATVPNSNMRVLGDVNAGVAYEEYLFLEWLSRMMMPDTSENRFLLRWSGVWLKGGRKPAAFATGKISVAGTAGAAVPKDAVLTAAAGLEFRVTDGVTLTTGTAEVSIAAITPGNAGNLLQGAKLSFSEAHAGIDAEASTMAPGLGGGVDEESDLQLGIRMIERIQDPAAGGKQSDYPSWAKEVPGVTRAWSATEMGVGTHTVRFMMDDDRPNGIPTAADVALVHAHVDAERPVTVKDYFTVAPVTHSIDIAIADLAGDTPAIRTEIENRLKILFRRRASPGQTMYQAWFTEAIALATGETEHTLSTGNVAVAPYVLPILGEVTYV